MNCDALQILDLASLKIVYANALDMRSDGGLVMGLREPAKRQLVFVRVRPHARRSLI